jgi:hypothetical protein
MHTLATVTIIQPLNFNLPLRMDSPQISDSPARVEHQPKRLPSL